MEDDDIRKPREIIVFPQTLENLGIEELEEYIGDQEKEIDARTTGLDFWWPWSGLAWS